MTQYTPQEQQEAARALIEVLRYIETEYDIVISSPSPLIEHDETLFWLALGIIKHGYTKQPLAIKPLEDFDEHNEIPTAFGVYKIVVDGLAYYPHFIGNDPTLVAGIDKDKTEMLHAANTHHRELVGKCLVPGSLIYVGLSENAIDSRKFFTAPVNEGKGWSEEEIAGFIRWAVKSKWQKFRGSDNDEWFHRENEDDYSTTAELLTEYQRHLESLKQTEKQ